MITFISCYIDVKTKLSKIYGIPTETDNTDFDISNGISSLMATTYAEHAPYLTTWIYEKGKVLLQLQYTKNNWNLILAYLSPTLNDFFIEQKKKQSENNSGL